MGGPSKTHPKPQTIGRFSLVPLLLFALVLLALKQVWPQVLQCVPYPRLQRSKPFLYPASAFALL
jgi:hypothetical protein